MTPGARVQAAIDILEAIAAGGQGRGGAPADLVANGYFRSRRYIGSKDRQAIATLVYGLLRHRAQLDWWIAHIREGANRGLFALDPRQRVIAALAILEGWTADEIDGAFDGDRFRPAPLSQSERQQVSSLVGRSIDHPDQPPPARYNAPDWVLPSLRVRFGADLAQEMRALNTEAPLDLRANALKGDRNAAIKALRAADVAAEPTRLSPWGLRVLARPNLSVLEPFKNGLVEVQDEGSQVASLLVGAKPGMRVVDFCAGAGGKSLAIAASMNNKGHVVATDISGRRLEGATKRLRRAGVHNVESRHLTGERDPWVKRHAGAFDRVLIDAPCSGTGTWRRNPDARWTLTPQDIMELRELQGRILGSAARLVKPGGRLIYVTCSLLPEENERQAEGFAAVQEEFTLLPISRVWAETIGGKAPSADPYLKLSPAKHGTDGFFVAVFERKSAEGGEKQ